MIISVNWLKKFTSIDGTIDELATRIGARLVEIESVINLTEKYKDVIIVKVVECGPLEGSDHLNVTKIDDGGAARDIERDENGLVQVVCGAPNVRAGMLAAWLPPRSVVPETYGTDEPFVLGAKPLRGVMSNGMLASARELDLFDDHTGILEIDKEAAAGTSFAELYELNDYLLDIENKSLTHRPDTFGIIGFAREVAGIQGTAFHTPEWLTNLETAVGGDNLAAAPQVVIDDAALCDRFTAVVLHGVNDDAVSPLQLQTYLARSGVRPVNAAVDVSNYLMLLTGQPSHMYDYDKLLAIAGDSPTIHVRTAKKDEQLRLLDGKDIALDETDIVISAGETAVGLAGIMGGESTAVDKSTQSILLEVASFDLYHMRSSQMRHGIFSEAVTRFTKGIPAPLAAPVMTRAVELLQKRTGAIAASQPADVYPGSIATTEVTVSVNRINSVLGTKYSAEDIAELLKNVEFSVDFEEDEARITVPYWRHDIHIPEDIIEEIGRLSGYDSIEFALPSRDFVAVRPSAFDELRSKLRQRLVRTGANEVLTYSFIHGDIMKKAGQSTDNAYRITNSISPSLQYYRQSLLPSLLSHVSQNSKAGFGSFALFEFNKVHQKSDGLTEEKVPLERDSAAYVVADTKSKEAAYYEAKRVLEYMVSANSQSQLRFVPLIDAKEKKDATWMPFEPKRSALVFIDSNSEPLGVVGEFQASVRRSFKLPYYSAGFEISPRQLVLAANEGVAYAYKSLSKYPSVERDVCFQVQQDLPYEVVYGSVVNGLAKTPYETSVEPLDIYQAEASGVKNITVRVQLASYHKTLTSEEVSQTMDKVITSVLKETDGKVI